ncbi:MAG: aminomethyl-transferring glycine dehydrogenase subunit GcvPA [Candidatus Diapherotrites archaeon]|nr:aminomethyl-transferring glycine dehydrogenase subunit GcvPA [Candidatus Diapherotrites archaeon]
MLKAIGAQKTSDLFKGIPKKILLTRDLGIPSGLSELETRSHLFALSKKNANVSDYDFFIGGGVYDHFIPAAVWALVSRGEFLTAYTPYQPEVSQGMLQSIFEWQTSICELTGMDVSNASNYDGAEACAQAVLMGKNISRRKKILVSSALNPEYMAVAKTYANANGLEFVEVATEGGVTSLADLAKKIDDATAGVVVQSPNFFGCIEDLAGLGKAVHGKKAVFIVAVSEALSLGLLKSPGYLGADIVVGDAQSFGIPMSFGGPHAGFIATRNEFVRHLPGRIVGVTNDASGNRGFIMTLQAREQHIRREKANSSICTNQALCALAATIHLSLLGKKGVMGLALQNHERASWLYEKLSEISGVELPFRAPFFNEFVVKIKNLRAVQEKLLEKKIVFGFALEKKFPALKDHCLVAMTEMNSDEQAERLVSELKAVVK